MPGFITLLKSSWRFHKRNWTVGLLVIAGISLGLATATFLFSIVYQELTFDRTYPDSDRMYVVLTHNSEGSKSKNLHFPALERIKSGMAGTEKVAAYFGPMDDLSVTYSDAEYKPFTSRDIKVVFCSPEYPEQLFGEKYSSTFRHLLRPATCLLSESLAKKWFGSLDPIGKLLKIDREIEVTVEGVIPDLDTRTSFPFDMMVSQDVYLSHYLPKNKESDWWFSSEGGILLTLLPSVDPQQPNQFLAEMTAEYVVEKDRITYDLMPVYDIHLEEGFFFDFNYQAPKELIILPALFGVLLLLAVSLCLSNLLSGRSIQRKKESFVRQVTGGSNTVGFSMITGECLLLFLVSFPLSLLIFMTLTTKINELLSVANYQLGLSSEAIIILSICLLLTAFPPIISRIGNPLPTHSLKNKRITINHFSFEKFTLLLHGGLTFALAFLSTVVILQITEWKTTALGFNSEKMAALVLPSDRFSRLEAFKNTAISSTGAKVTLASHYPGNGSWGSVQTNEKPEPLPADIIFCEPGYFRNFEIDTLTIGSTRGLQIYLNRKAIHDLGLHQDEALGTAVTVDVAFRENFQARINGIVEDVLGDPVTRNTRPQVYIIGKTPEYVTWKAFIQTTDEKYSGIKQVFTQFWPDEEYRMGWVKDEIADSHLLETLMAELLEWATIILLAISAITIFTSVHFYGLQRRKEIAIRKINGASTPDLIRQIVWKFGKWQLAGVCLLLPVSWYAGGEWLDNYAFHIPMSILPIVIAVSVQLVSGFLLVAGKVRYIANLDPVNNLRHEEWN